MVISIKVFNDYLPKKEKTYFTEPFQKQNLGVVIPFFNEEANELKVTLEDLHKCYLYLCEYKPVWREKEMCIVMIQDGWFKSSSSMKEFLKKLFPCKLNDKMWWENEEFINEDMERDEKNLTYIFENTDYNCINADKDIYLNITLIVKLDNRRKHNSHEWFLGHSGFAEASKSKYLLCTDAFTLFRHTCIYHLVNNLDNNIDVSVATGRQRVMTREQQGSLESDFSISNWLRHVQRFDFELANSIYNGAFSLGGFLPVIPGPCGLYRARDILQDSARDWYFGIVNEDPSKTGLVLGNLKIAEDRILSYASVLKVEGNKRMAFVPLALFYFEAETNLEKFMLQRRRWINGSVAGYIYMLFFRPDHIFNWNGGFVRKFYIWLLLLLQAVIYLTVVISPAYTMRLLYYSFNYLLSAFGFESDIGILSSIVWILFITHLIVHSKRKFNYFIIYLLLIIAVITMLFGLTAIGYYIFVDSEGGIINLLGSSYAMKISIFVFTYPFILAALLSGRCHSVIKMFKSFIPYMLFLPMLISWFGSYSFTRVWDLSWGNRPTTEIKTETTDRELMQRKFKNQGMKVTIMLFFLNIVVFFIPRQYQEFILSFFFTSVAFQMIFSTFYMLSTIPQKINFCCLNMKKKKQIHPSPKPITEMTITEKDEEKEIELSICEEEKSPMIIRKKDEECLMIKVITKESKNEIPIQENQNVFSVECDFNK